MFKKGVIGLDIGSRFIKVVQLKEKKNEYQLERVGVMPIASELIVEGSMLDAPRVVDALKELINKSKIKIKNTVLSVSGHSSVIVKRVTMPEMTEEELRESIKFEAEQYVPFDIDEVSLDFQILSVGEQEGQMDVVIVAVKKEKIEEYVSVVREAGLIPIIVDVDAFALENMYEINYDIEAEKNVALVNAGASSININIIKGGASLFTRDSGMGSNLHSEALQREFAVSYDEAERIKIGNASFLGETQEETSINVSEEELNNVLLTSSEEIISEISKSFEYFKSSTTHEEIHEIVLSGGCAMVGDFPKQLSERFGVEVKLAEPFKNISIASSIDKDFLHEVEHILPVAVGLARRRSDDR
jgi:type IV pilus assembly protein PilM